MKYGDAILRESNPLFNSRPFVHALHSMFDKFRCNIHSYFKKFNGFDFTIEAQIYNNGQHHRHRNFYLL